jgi:hypothetical protein
MALHLRHVDTASQDAEGRGGSGPAARVEASRAWTARLPGNPPPVESDRRALEFLSVARSTVDQGRATGLAIRLPFPAHRDPRQFVVDGRADARPDARRLLDRVRWRVDLSGSVDPCRGALSHHTGRHRKCDHASARSSVSGTPFEGHTGHHRGGVGGSRGALAASSAARASREPGVLPEPGGFHGGAQGTIVSHHSGARTPSPDSCRAGSIRSCSSCCGRRRSARSRSVRYFTEACTRRVSLARRRGRRIESSIMPPGSGWSGQ